MPAAGTELDAERHTKGVCEDRNAWAMHACGTATRFVSCVETASHTQVHIDRQATFPRGSRSQGRC